MLYNETPTKGFVMSTETTENTAASKKSFLTRLSECVEASKAATESEKTTPESEEARAKRALKKTGLVLAGTLAASVAAIVIMNRMNQEETEENAEETSTSED